MSVLSGAGRLFLAWVSEACVRASTHSSSIHQRDTLCSGAWDGEAMSLQEIRLQAGTCVHEGRHLLTF